MVISVAIDGRARSRSRLAALRMIFERSKAEILRHVAKPLLGGFERAVEVARCSA